MRCNGPRGVAPGWFVIAPFGATGNSSNIKTYASGEFTLRRSCVGAFGKRPWL